MTAMFEEICEAIAYSLACAGHGDLADPQIEAAAKAVLLAMRKFSPAVTMGGPDPGAVHHLSGAPEDIWRWVIDAALGEPR